MNIQAQCCGIALMLVLLFFYVRQKKLRLNTERAFLLIFSMSFLCVFLDIMSIVAITHMDTIPLLLMELICKSYLASLVGVAICGLIYVYADINSKIIRYRNFMKVYFCLAAIGIALVYILPIQYYYKPDLNKLYTYGPSVLTTYAFSFFFLITLFILSMRQRKCMNKSRREAVMTWMFIWICAAFIQFLNNNLLLIGYAGCIGIMVLYLKLENPETNLDRTTGLFNQNALVQYIQQLYRKNEPFSLVSILIEQSVKQNFDTDLSENVRIDLIDCLSRISDGKVFKNAADEIIIVFNSETAASKWLDAIQEQFYQILHPNDELGLRTSILFIPDAYLVDNGEDLFYLIRHARQTNKEFSDNALLTVTKDTALQMYEERKVKQLVLDAMDANRVEVFYQPIFSTEKQQFTSAEALVRIRDEDGSIIPPNTFIPVAEQNGMILKLGEIVFEKVCSFIKREHLEQYGIQYIEVNLSMIQCADEHLSDTYIGIMEKYHVNPDMINLEITESASLNAKKILLDNMKCLMNYGIKFSLDDFGTGQSNLNYIVDMPVDIVKFDRGMINAYFDNGKAKYVMDAAMHMIHGMELKIVSEGVETKQQYQIMQELGISYIQGYYFSKPLPEADFLKFLAEKQ